MSVRAARVDQFAVGGIYAVLVLSPWPLGSRLPWAAMLSCTVIIAIGAMWLSASLWTNQRITLPTPLILIALFLLWTGGQWATGSTIYAHATAFECVRLLSYALVFWMAANLAKSPSVALGLRRLIVAMGIAVGAFGLLQFLTWNGSLFWFYDSVFSGTPFGPFNNRNYFAGYLAVTLPLGIATAFSGERLRRKAVMLVGLWLAVLAALVCLSRGGVVALSAVGVFLYFTVVRAAVGARAEGVSRSRNFHRVPPRVLAANVVFALFAGLLWIGQADRVLARLETIFEFRSTSSIAGRADLWLESLPMVWDRPVTGFGLNTYMFAFPTYRVSPTSVIETNAHNEYLEVLIETGIVGALLCLAFLVLLVRQGWTRFRGAASARERTIRAGAIAGWVAVMTYGITDFPTIIPAIDYVLAVLAGLMAANGAGWDETEPR